MWWIWTVWVGLASGAPVDTLMSDLGQWKVQRTSGTVPNIPRADYQRALDGEVVTGIEVVEDIKAAKGYGVIVIDLPIDLLWRAIADEDHHAGHLPVSHSRTIEGKPRSNDHTIFQYIDIPILTDRWWLVRIRYNSTLYTASNGRAWELWWTDRIKETSLRSRLDASLLDDGMPIAWSKGAWLLVDLGGGKTLVEYHTWSDPGGSVPVGPATRFAAGEVQSNLKSMAKFAQEHTPTCSGRFVKPDGSAF
jgi:hypothetical protein